MEGGGIIENRSSSESGYGTSVGDTRDTRMDTEQDEVFYMEEEMPLRQFRPHKSHHSLRSSSTNFQYK